MEIENIMALLEAEVRSPTDVSGILPPSLNSPGVASEKFGGSPCADACFTLGTKVTAPFIEA